MIKIKKYVISFIVVVLVVLGSWAFLVTQDDVEDSPNTTKKVELKRTTDAYGDIPFESGSTCYNNKQPGWAMETS